MNLPGRTFSPTAINVFLALATLSGFALVPQIAFADLPVTVLASFNGTSGYFPESSVILDNNDNVYGTTSSGGAGASGTVYEIVKGSSTITTIASFSNTNGFSSGNVIFDSIGNLYGTVGGGKNGHGTIYEIVKGSNIITDLASFNESNGDGPIAVTFDSNGNLYGTTNSGGANGGSSGGYGTVFELAKGSNTITDIASFNGSNGANPRSGITLDANGNLYGTTQYGGAFSCGTVYEIAKGSNSITDLASFDGSNGAAPLSGITFDSSGDLYGTTALGGANSNSNNRSGTVYKIVKGSNTITDIASFNGSNGANPYGGVIFDSSGNLFGTTHSGGAIGGGTVYEIAKGSNTISVLASFNGGNGYEPYEGVTLDSSGNLYGSSYSGGLNGDGTVYEIAGAAMPVPETSSALSFGLLIMLGIAGPLLLVRRRVGMAVVQTTGESEADAFSV